jgi:ketosteroid isomerase-like protein
MVLNKGGFVLTIAGNELEAKRKSSTGNETPRRRKVKKLAVVNLLVCTCVGLALARPQAASDSGVTQTIKQFEHDWAAAAIAHDAGKMNAILADDWVRIAPDGKMETKKDAMANLKSNSSKLISAESGPMEIKVIGKVAVVQGTDTEKSMANGKDTSGTYAWMDVLENVGGKWMVVRSAATMVK